MPRYVANHLLIRFYRGSPLCSSRVVQVFLVRQGSGLEPCPCEVPYRWEDFDETINADETGTSEKQIIVN